MFMLLSTIITYLIALFFKYNNIVPKIGDIHDWITFSGSILGGSITMIALFFTMLQDRKSIKEEHKLSIRPILFCQIRNKEKYGYRMVINNCVNNYGSIRWKMMNTTPNIADKIRIIKEDTYAYDPETEELIDCNCLVKKWGISIFTVELKEYVSLPPNGSQYMRTNFALEKDENDEFKCGSAFMFTHTILIEYTDYTGENVYKSKFNFEININIDVNNEPHFFLWSVSNTLIED